MAAAIAGKLTTDFRPETPAMVAVEFADGSMATATLEEGGSERVACVEYSADEMREFGETALPAIMTNARCRSYALVVETEPGRFEIALADFDEMTEAEYRAGDAFLRVPSDVRPIETKTVRFELGSGFCAEGVVRNKGGKDYAEGWLCRLDRKTLRYSLPVEEADADAATERAARYAADLRFAGEALMRLLDQGEAVDAIDGKVVLLVRKDAD